MLMLPIVCYAETAARLPCSVCNRSSGRTITCDTCNCQVHPQCLGLGQHAYPADTFTCAKCVLEAAKLEGLQESVKDAAHKLVWLRGMRVQNSSQNTYASGLHRYVKFGECCGKAAHELLPPGPAGVVDLPTLHLFISWAASKYKYNTISSTLNALIDWHKSKGVPYDAISCQATKTVTVTVTVTLLATVKSEQGPAGLPAGKQGLSKAMLRLLIAHLHKESKKRPAMAELLLRDECAILLGFYGMMRRSEIVALTPQDITIGVIRHEKYVEINIQRSKTDRGRVGATVTITGKSREGLNIAGPLERFLQMRAPHTPSTAPFLGRLDLDALECHPTEGITGQALARRLQDYLRALKQRYPEIQVNPASYGMHSLRRGGVTAAWEAGVDIEKIKAHGRWRSDAVRTYMQATRTIRLMVSRCM